MLSVQEEHVLYLTFSLMMCYFGGKGWNSQTDEESDGRTDGGTDGQTGGQAGRYLASAKLCYII